MNPSILKRHVFLISLFLITNLILLSQSIPSESTKAKVSNKLGYHNVMIEYSRPIVDGRNIWGSLVPYGQVWRTGADYPTFITLEDTVSVEGYTVHPGKYALYTIPEEKEWTVILSSNTKLWGAYGYTDADDVLRVRVNPEVAPYEESFLIYFSDTKSTSCDLVLHWEKIKVKIQLSVDITHQVIEGLEKKIEKGEAQWGDYWKGAKFLLLSSQQKSMALDWIENSVSIEKNWMNMATFAEVLAWNDQIKEAITSMKKALDLCIEQTAYCPYKKVYQDKIDNWLR